jgi:AmmeMemoRadiSam system protein B
MKENIRRRKLPEGWYPDTEKGVLSSIENWESGNQERSGKSVVVPHAGWYFSGKIASNTIKLLDKNTDIIVVAGGHLSEYDSVLVADEDYFETPLGNIRNSQILKKQLLNEDFIKTDRVPDNTVEIQLPFVKNYFPESEIIWMRVPPDIEKVKKVSEMLVLFEKKSGKKISVVGSTDLTHYGPNYGFETHGRGDEALSWVKNVNDKNYIDLLLDYNIEDSLKHSITQHSACSSGGSALAAFFAFNSGCSESELLYYYTSNDIYPSDSFVGYAGIIYF